MAAVRGIAEEGGTGTEQRHQVGSGVKRVGDRASAVQAERGAQAAVLLGDEDLARERGGVVEGGEAREGGAVGDSCAAQHDRVCGGVVMVVAGGDEHVGIVAPGRYQRK